MITGQLQQQQLAGVRAQQTVVVTANVQLLQALTVKQNLVAVLKKVHVQLHVAAAHGVVGLTHVTHTKTVRAQQTAQATANVQFHQPTTVQTHQVHVHRKVLVQQHVMTVAGVGATAVTLMKAVHCHGVVALLTAQA